MHEATLPVHSVPVADHVEGGEKRVDADHRPLIPLALPGVVELVEGLDGVLAQHSFWQVERKRGEVVWLVFERIPPLLRGEFIRRCVLPEHEVVRPRLSPEARQSIQAIE